MLLERRTVLRSGGAVAAAALGGCIGGDDDADGDDDTGAEADLTIENVTFTDGEPGGYQEFEEAGTDTFDEDEVVWLYFEPVGFGREGDGDGEVDIDITMGISVEGPDGEELYSADDTLARTVPEGSDVEAFFTGHFQPPTPATDGEYTAILSVEDHVTGESVETTVTFIIDAEPDLELDIEHVRFVADRPADYRQYDEVHDKTYRVDEPIWIYFEPTGWGREEAEGDEVGFDLITTLVVTDPDGTEVFADDELLRGTIPEDQADEQFLFWNVVLPQDAQTGEYTANIALEDQTTDQETETTVTFTVEGEEETSLAEEFPAILEAELAVEVTAFRSNETVDLEYETPHPIDSGDAEYEIGYVAGLFAEAVAEGWDVDGLVATVTDGEGDQYQYEIDADAAASYAAGDIDDAEFINPIFESLETV